MHIYKGAGQLVQVKHEKKINKLPFPFLELQTDFVECYFVCWFDYHPEQRSSRPSYNRAWIPCQWAYCSNIGLIHEICSLAPLASLSRKKEVIDEIF